MASQRIAVTGATGRVGRHIVDVLTEQGHDVAPIARSTGVDVVTGEGLAEALTGVDAVIDAATPPTPDERVATEFFTADARNLQELGSRAGIQRIVLVSIIGIDEFAEGYQAAKQVQERETLSGSIPARILRAAQFHEFVDQLVEWSTQDGVSYVPKMRTQLVAARTVAEALADLATATEPAAPGSIPEIAGPREENLVEAATLLVASRDEPIRVEAVSNPDDPATGLYEGGALLPGPGARLAGPTFEEWLNEQATNGARVAA
jgi:uncharacterized protein YbjT (DUF2867 family)